MISIRRSRTAKDWIAGAVSLALFLTSAGWPASQAFAQTLGAARAGEAVRVNVLPLSPVSSLVPLSALTLDAAALAPSLNVAPLAAAAAPAAASAPQPVSAAFAPSLAAVPAVGLRGIFEKSAAAGRNGSARDSMVSFRGAVADQANAGSRVAQLFDAARGRVAAAAEAEEEAPGETLPEDAPAEAAAAHKQYEKTAAARLEAFNAEVKKLKSGRYGVAIKFSLDEGKLRVAYLYTVDGRLAEESEIDAKVAAGELPRAEWETARALLKAAKQGLLKKLVAVVQQNENDHQAVHQEMERIAKDLALKSVQESLAKGKDLQAWGLPVSISVDRDTSLRYVRLYRLSGMPTDLGDALHDLLAPLVAADPKFLSRVTSVQLHEAVQLLSQSLEYSMDSGSPDGGKRLRLGGAKGGDYDYPEARQAIVDLARKKLTAPPLREDQLAGLDVNAVAPERQTSTVLRQVLMDTIAEYSQKTQAGEDVSGIAPLLLALHAALGMPVRTEQGAVMLTIKHRQLLPLVAELRRRQVHDDVVSAVIRTFPLGESLQRLGVDRLWAQGLTGKGVKIAVIDNGVDMDHPDFSDLEDPIVENMTRDRGVHTKGGHATPMASILHAIAPDAEIQSYQALPNTGLPGVTLNQEEIKDALIKAMDRARANGAQIINMSLGIPTLGYASDALAKKVSELAKEGIVVVVSAGNEGYDLPNGYQVRSPATSPDAIAVGAVNYHSEIHGNQEAFGSQGLVFDPSKNVVSERPDIWAFGVNVKAAAQLPASLYQQEPVPYQNSSGTSPAAPHVSGVVALMLQAAQEAGRSVAKPEIAGLVRQALVAAAAYVDRHPVMNDAAKAVEAYLAAAAPAASK